MRSITGRSDDLADEMKALEMQEAGRKVLARVPLVARLDGRAFHTFTRGMARPYDIEMMRAMAAVTKALVGEFKAIVGYTQSDEISLVFLNPENLFGGRLQKLHSVLAGYASACFAQIAVANYVEKKPGWAKATPCFDCRVWQVSDLETALDALVWREDDAVKNSVAMLAQAHFSHRELHCKGRCEMLDMLHSKGVNWNAQPVHFKRGIYIKHRVILRTMTEEELACIPKAYRPGSETKVSRGELFVLPFPPIRSVARDVAVMNLFAKESDIPPENHVIAPEGI